MGLDNMPSKYPCERKNKPFKVVKRSLEECKKIFKPELVEEEYKKGLTSCDLSDCPFKELNNYKSLMFGTHCWIRGKCYDDIAELVGDSLYDKHNPKQTRELLIKLQEIDMNLLNNIDDDIEETHKKYEHLVKWLEMLIRFRVGFHAWF